MASLQYVLAQTTINLPPRDAVAEIHLLRIDLKRREFDFDVLRCIDAVWRFPTLFELAHSGQIRMVAAYKRPTSADAAKWSCSNYYLPTA